MRIRISHRISYVYAEPVRQLTQILRLTPRDHDGQSVMNWRIEPTIDGRLRIGEDPYGNVTHTFSADGSITELDIDVAGTVETVDLAGVVRGSHEPIPADVFLRDTPLSLTDEALRGFAADRTREAGTPLARAHMLMETIHAELACDAAGERAPGTAASAFAERVGTPADLAHVFIACARHLEIPARYVSGYVARSETLAHANGSHAWAEAYLEGYGWIGFDCANGLCPIDTHVRVAIGLDSAEAAPVRGARTGGDGETLSITISAGQ